MGRGWVNTIKTANAAKKGAMFTKFAREIQVAAKLGGPDPNFNARLRMAVEAAKKASCPNDTIDRAIKKGSGQLEGSEIEEITYEGYGPHGVGIIVEVQSDNRNRTAPEMRLAFKQNNGNLGETGSVAWMFDRVCLVEATKAGKFDPEEEAIEAGANEVVKTDETYAFYGAVESMEEIRKALVARGWTIGSVELSYRPKNPTVLDEAQKKEVIALLQELDDHDDTHRVHATLPDA